MFEADWLNTKWQEGMPTKNGIYFFIVTIHGGEFEGYAYPVVAEYVDGKIGEVDPSISYKRVLGHGNLPERWFPSREYDLNPLY